VVIDNLRYVETFESEVSNYYKLEKEVPYSILPIRTQYVKRYFSGLTPLKWKTVSAILENDPEGGKTCMKQSFYQRN
jgi:hypothetical protein